MDIEILRQEYDSIYPTAQRLKNAVADQIKELASNESITLGVPLEFRVKEWISVQEKIKQNHLDLKSIAELSDLIGIRIILLFQRDLSRMCSALANTFLIVSQEDTSERLGEAQFGYRSLHYNLKLPEAWLTMPTFSNCEEFIIEAQIRTLAQHIWAVASHELQYKQEHNVPPPVRRSIYRVSALLETVDLEFERVLQDRDSYKVQVTPTSVKDELNVDLLEMILSSKLPAKNMTSDESYSDLLSDLSTLGIKTSGSLLKLIDKYLNGVIAEDAAIVCEMRIKGDQAATMGERTYIGTTQDRIDKGVYFGHVGLIREMFVKAFGKDWVKKRVKDAEPHTTEVRTRKPKK